MISGPAAPPIAVSFSNAAPDSISPVPDMTCEAGKAITLSASNASLEAMAPAAVISSAAPPPTTLSTSKASPVAIAPAVPLIVCLTIATTLSAAKASPLATSPTVPVIAFPASQIITGAGEVGSGAAFENDTAVGGAAGPLITERQTKFTMRMGFRM